MRTFFKSKHGNTLVEVLAAVTIFSLVVIPMISFFTQAYSYTNRNEMKTVSINVARGVYEFMSNQDFSELKARMKGISEYNVYVGLMDGNEIDPSDPTKTKKIQVYKFQEKSIYEDPTVPVKGKVNPVQINNVKYNAYVKLKPSSEKPDYFIDIDVFVWEGEDKYSPPHDALIKGKIINETIR